MISRSPSALTSPASIQSTETEIHSPFEEKREIKESLHPFETTEHLDAKTPFPLSSERIKENKPGWLTSFSLRNKKNACKEGFAKTLGSIFAGLGGFYTGIGIGDFVYNHIGSSSLDDVNGYNVNQILITCGGSILSVGAFTLTWIGIRDNYQSTVGLKRTVEELKTAQRDDKERMGALEKDVLNYVESAASVKRLQIKVTNLEANVSQLYLMLGELEGKKSPTSTPPFGPIPTSSSFSSDKKYSLFRRKSPETQAGVHMLITLRNQGHVAPPALDDSQHRSQSRRNSLFKSKSSGNLPSLEGSSLLPSDLESPSPPALIYDSYLGGEKP